MMPKRVEARPDICGGEACVKGTRIPVSIVLSHLAAGEDIPTVLKNFPKLTLEDIQACLIFASELAHEKVLPLEIPR